jgi:hypothetical protein
MNGCRASQWGLKKLFLVETPPQCEKKLPLISAIFPPGYLTYNDLDL